MPTASVVIVTYNRPALLGKALGGALGQEDVDLEVVVVDNGSDRDTRQLLRSCSDARLRVVRHDRNIDATRARNSGLAAAEGDWVGMLDDDDLWAPDKLRAQLDALEATGRSWAYTGCVYIDASGGIVAGAPPLSPEAVMDALPLRYVIPGGLSSHVWHRNALDDGGMLDERLSFMDDWDLSLRLSRAGPPAAVIRPLVAYRQHGSNQSRNAEHYQSELAVIEAKFAELRNGRPIDRAAQQRFLGGEALRAGARGAALTAYLRGAWLGDRRLLLRAPAALLPRAVHPWLRRTLLSDRAWIAQAEAWLAHAA